MGALAVVNLIVSAAGLGLIVFLYTKLNGLGNDIDFLKSSVEHADSKLDKLREQYDARIKVVEADLAARQGGSGDARSPDASGV